MAVVALLILGAIVVGLVLLIRKFMDRKGPDTSDGSDVLPYLLLAVAVGTASFIDPACGANVIEGIRAFCDRHHITDVNELIGSLE